MEEEPAGHCTQSAEVPTAAADRKYPALHGDANAAPI